MKKSDILCRLWTLEYSRTTGRTDRRMTYLHGWYKIQCATEDIGWVNETGSNYRRSKVEEMVNTLMSRPHWSEK